MRRASIFVIGHCGPTTGTRCCCSGRFAHSAANPSIASQAASPTSEANSPYQTAYYIAFGPHGPRRPPPADEGRKVLFLTLALTGAGVAIFAFTRIFANPVRPRTMTKEWQEASEEYLKVRHVLPPHFPKFMLLTLPTIIGARQRSHHWLQGHVGAEPSREQG